MSAREAIGDRRATATASQPLRPRRRRALRQLGIGGAGDLLRVPAHRDDAIEEAWRTPGSEAAARAARVAPDVHGHGGERHRGIFERVERRLGGPCAHGEAFQRRACGSGAIRGKGRARPRNCRSIQALSSSPSALNRRPALGRNRCQTCAVTSSACAAHHRGAPRSNPRGLDPRGPGTSLNVL